MKLYHLAAATLLIGTSAFAWAPVKDKAPQMTWEQAAPAAGDPDMDLAENPDAAAPDPADAAPIDTAAPAPAPVVLASADLAVRPAAQNYPACDPGPGDDNCIQLYEPGVRVALAGWSQPTGGLAQPGEAMASAETAAKPAATGVGGPYEPIGGGTAETAMMGDGVLDPALGESADLEAAQAADSTGVTGTGIK